MKNSIKILRYLFEYIIIRIIFLLLYILPINLVSNLGGHFLKLFGPMSKSHNIAVLNFKRIYKNINDNNIKMMVKESWENLGRTIFEFSILDRILDKKNDRIKIEGIENIKTFIEKKEHVIFFTIHQSNWEIIVPTIDKLGVNVGAIYRHINNKFIDNLVLKKRNGCIDANKSFYTPKGKRSAKEILTAISNNSSILVLVDQKDSAGENIKFFNQIVKTQTGFLKIARKHNMRLIPVKNIRYNLNHFKITFCPSIEPFKKNLSDIEAMNEIHKIIEKWILDNPTQWFWQHNRFN